MTQISKDAISPGIGTGFTTATTPAIPSTLKMLEPTTLPMAMSALRRKAARTDEKRRTGDERDEAARGHDDLDDEAHGVTGLEELRLGGMKLARTVLPLLVGSVGIDEIDREQDEEGETGRARELAHQTDGDENGGGEKHHRAVPLQHVAVAQQRKDETGRAEDQQDVGDIGTDDIADRDARIAFEGTLQACDELRRGGAEADKRQSDEEGRDSKAGSQPRRALDQKFGAAEKQQKADDE